MRKVIHFEIPADDLNRVKKFYKDIFEWEMTDVPGYSQPYAIVRTVAVDAQNMPKEPGAINGGITMRSKKGEGPVIVIDVPSLDDFLKKITKAGGKVVQPKQDVMGMGLYARVTDTEGNVIGIWETVRK